MIFKNVEVLIYVFDISNTAEKIEDDIHDY